MATTNPNQAITGTGNAPIKRQGQTATNQYGSDPNAKVMGRSSVRDLNAK